MASSHLARLYNELVNRHSCTARKPGPLALLLTYRYPCFAIWRSTTGVAVVVYAPLKSFEDNHETPLARTVVQTLALLSWAHWSAESEALLMSKPLTQPAALDL